MNLETNLVIIGNSPATFTAAIYAATANLNPYVIETNKPTYKTSVIPGITSTSDYLSLVKQQALNFDTKVIANTIKQIFSSQEFEIILEDKVIRTKTLIIDDLEIKKKFFNDFVFLNDKRTNTTKKGLFFCGVAREELLEPIILAGSGCMAAIDAKEYIFMHG